MTKTLTKNLQFREPENLEDALDVITIMSVFLDFWLGRSGDWQLIQFMAKSVDKDIWRVVSKCVITQSGLSLMDVKFENLKTAGVLEALSVLCQGIMEIDLPDIYIQNCAGINTMSSLQLIKDAHKIKEELNALKEPSKIISNLLSRVIAGSL